jgi:hypothetical protein
MPADYYNTRWENKQRRDDITRMRIPANDFCDVAPFSSIVSNQISEV